MNWSGEQVMDLLARADPIRPEELATRVDAARSRVMLAARETVPVAATDRRGGRPFRVVLAALTAAAIAAAFLLTSGLPGRASNALAIERTDEYISLRIEDPGADAAQMNHELRERGIDIEVQAVPVLPVEVGHWVGGRAVWPGMPDDTDQHRLGDRRIRDLNEAARGRGLIRTPDDAKLIRVPAKFEGHWLLYAGRAARPGERPWIEGNPPGAR